MVFRSIGFQSVFNTNDNVFCSQKHCIAVSLSPAPLPQAGEGNASMMLERRGMLATKQNRSRAEGAQIYSSPLGLSLVEVY
jgi:hypothetical protein